MELHALCHTWIVSHLDWVTLGLCHTWIGSPLDCVTLGLGHPWIVSHLDWGLLGLGHTWIVMTSVAFVASLGTRGPTICCVYGIEIYWPCLTDDSLSGTRKGCLTGTQRLQQIDAWYGEKAKRRRYFTRY